MSQIRPHGLDRSGEEPLGSCRTSAGDYHFLSDAIAGAYLGVTVGTSRLSLLTAPRFSALKVNSPQKLDRMPLFIEIALVVHQQSSTTYAASPLRAKYRRRGFLKNLTLHRSNDPPIVRGVNLKA